MLKPTSILQFEARPIRVLAVGPQILLSGPFVRTLARDRRIELSAQTCEGEGLLERARRHRPRVLIIGDELPRGPDPIGLRGLIRDLPDTRIVLLASAQRSQRVAAAIRAGISGCLDPAGLDLNPVSVVECVAGGLHVFAPFALEALRRESTMREAGVEAPADAALTARETGVLSGLLSGRTNREIAAAMHLSEGTVKNHVSRILSKLQVRSRTELVARHRHRTTG